MVQCLRAQTNDIFNDTLHLFKGNCVQSIREIHLSYDMNLLWSSKAWYQVRGMMLHLHTSTRPFNLSGSLHVRYIQLLYNYELKRYVSRNRLVLYYCKLIYII